MFVTMGLVGIVGALGIGCAGARPTVEAPPASPASPTMGQAPARPVQSLRPVGVAKAMKTNSLRPARSEEAHASAQAPAETPEAGVSLHGPIKTYIESFDPSGWGGPSTPRGGGPRPELDENPYDVPESGAPLDGKDAK